MKPANKPTQESIVTPNKDPFYIPPGFTWDGLPYSGFTVYPTQTDGGISWGGQENKIY